jgi:hypothetical protein
VDHFLVRRVLEPRKEQEGVSYHLTEYNANVEASRLEVEAAVKGRDRSHTSGHRYLRWGVRRAFFFLWEVYEYTPHQRPRV